LPRSSDPGENIVVHKVAGVRSTSAVNVNEGIGQLVQCQSDFPLRWTIFSGDDDLGRLAADLSQRVERVHKEPTHSAEQAQNGCHFERGGPTVTLSDPGR